MYRQQNIIQEQNTLQVIMENDQEVISFYLLEDFINHIFRMENKVLDLVFKIQERQETRCTIDFSSIRPAQQKLSVKIYASVTDNYYFIIKEDKTTFYLTERGWSGTQKNFNIREVKISPKQVEVINKQSEANVPAKQEDNINGKRCVSCQQEIEEGVAFCSKCGKSQLIVAEKLDICINSDCKAELKNSAKFCHQCGTKQNDVETKACINCGADAPVNLLYCPVCGENRKLLAVKKCVNNKCNKEIKKSAEICKYCGTEQISDKVVKYCKYCGNQHKRGTIYCNQTGKKL